VLIFGGIYDGHPNDDVVAYSQYGWSKIGKLKTINFQMTAIEVNGRDIFVFGGSGDIMSIEKNTEVWRPIPGEDRLGTFEVHEIEPILRSWFMPIVITF